STLKILKIISSRLPEKLLLCTSHLDRVFVRIAASTRDGPFLSITILCCRSSLLTHPIDILPLSACAGPWTSILLGASRRISLSSAQFSRTLILSPPASIPATLIVCCLPV